MLAQTYDIPDLPPATELETISVFKALAAANRALAELKGRAAAVPNQGILIDTLALQEARASSEIENIVTTQDELFQAEAHLLGRIAGPAKEVALYRDAMKAGYDRMLTGQGLITNATLIKIFQVLLVRSDGFRTTPGTALLNEKTGDHVYVPPQRPDDIIRHMSALEQFINDDQASDLDPLIKMALIHHQFESIHPFPDGNGRVGRILNVLYLTRSDLLDIPILYLSGYITSNKRDYYRLLQAVRDEGAWEEWVLYILYGIEQTAQSTLALVEGIRHQMATVKQRMRSELPKIYSQDLLNNLFRHPYTRIEFVQQDLGVARKTARSYLRYLAEHDFVVEKKSGKHKYYVNVPLVRLFLND